MPSESGARFGQLVYQPLEVTLRVPRHEVMITKTSHSVALLLAAMLVVGCNDRGRSAPAQNRSESAPPASRGLWNVYEQSLKNAKYIDLTHTITPSIPVWKGFGSAKFGRTINPETGKRYEYGT